MRVNNQTSDPVDWEQNGGSPQPYTAGSASPAASAIEGQLAAYSESGDFPPVGLSPWEVSFTSIDIKPEKSAKSPEITNPNATVTLNDNWTVTVT